MSSTRKKKKTIIFLLIVIVVGLFAGLIYTNSRQRTVLSERDKAKADKEYYLSKMEECSGYANTTNYVVNTANLTNCGGSLAVNRLYVAPLSNIYNNYCRDGFGSAVYGCAYKYSKTVYVCKPGTSVYDKKYAYSTRYYIYYRTFSYSCSEAQARNTIRHELLHLVYADLSSAERANVNAKLSSYRYLYSSQLAVYPSNERDEELFVRVGADGRYVDDIELIELYSKVSAVYTPQKRSYYNGLAEEADNDINKYTSMSNKYTAISATSTASMAFTASALVYVIAKRSTKTNKKKTRKKSIWDLPIAKVKSPAK